MTEQNQQNKPLSWTAPTTPNNKPSNDSKNTVKKSSEQRSTATVFAISAGVTILLLAIAGWLFLGIGVKKPAEVTTGTPDTSATTPVVTGTKTDTSATTGSDTTTTVNSSDIMTLGDSQPAGTTVALSSVNITAPTWVIVYESRNGTPGNILGAALFLTSQKDGSVELLRGTSAGATYFVAAALDNGDRSFSMKDDQPIKDANGNPQLLTFVAK